MTTRSYRIIQAGENRSFAADHPLCAAAAQEADIVLLLGKDAGAAFRELRSASDSVAVIVELGMECLGVHTGEARGAEGSNVVGCARYRQGDAPPTDLVELVRQPRTDEAALAAARAVFEGAGFQVAVCGDVPGRIVDRLVRPYYNAALRRLDEGLASADDLDKTLKLGLGYPRGPIDLLEATGLRHHFEVTQVLYEAYGDPAYAPARRARVAKQRQS